MVTPASRAMSTMRRACSVPVSPQALKSGPRPPNVPAPKLRAGTRRPDAPSLRYSMTSSL
jgi:hypothetical protein